MAHDFNSQSFQRINITLPGETLELLDKVAGRGDRSKVIDKAVRWFVTKVGRTNLRKALKEGAIARSERDLGLVGDWFALDEEAWQKQ